METPYITPNQQALFETALNQSNETAAWDAINELGQRATPGILARLHSLSQSSIPSERRISAHILGKLADTNALHQQECIDLLLTMLAQEQEAPIIDAICCALGLWQDPRAIEPMLQHLQHPDDNVRFAITFGLLNYDEPQAIAGLIQLSNDHNTETRNRATYGLGTLIETDTPEIRNALAARLNDPIPTIQYEAIAGLARRHDPRAFEPLLTALRSAPYEALLIEAATQLADTRLLPALLAFRDDTWSNNTVLHKAIEACSGHNQHPH